MTIKDIAERCGVSVSTVSRVLNKHPDVSAAVRARVLAVVEEVHYVPNNSARDLVRPASDTVGLIVRGVGNPFFTEVIQAIEQTVSDAGYTMVLHQINSGENELLAGAELMRSKRLRGLLFLGGRSDYAPNETDLLDVPFVCCSYTNSFNHLPKSSYSSVAIDDRREAYRAVDFLIRKGHRRIAVLLDSTEDRSISELRYMGYCRALEEHGIPLDRELVLETGNYAMHSAYETVRRFVDKETDCTAVFAISDSMAMAAIRALHDSGKRVPEDCSVIAIDGIAMSAYMIPTLTTLSQPKWDMGETSVRLLLDLIEGKAQNRHVILRTDLREGESVRGL